MCIVSNFLKTFKALFVLGANFVCSWVYSSNMSISNAEEHTETTLNPSSPKQIIFGEFSLFHRHSCFPPREKLNMAPLKKEKGWALQSTHNLVPFWLTSSFLPFALLRWQRRLYVAMASSNEPL
jgi:hypothetical protein